MAHTLRNSGFTLVEVLVVITITVALAGVVLTSFASIRNYFALRTAVADVHAALISARAATLAARDDSVHGVHIASTEIVSFSGATYNAGTTGNLTNQFEYGVTASFSGSSPNVVFARLTGEASATGTITLTESRSGRTATIVIYESGLIEL